MKNLLLILAIATLFSCRTVKKEWVKENYQSKIEAVALAEETLNRAESLTIDEIQKLTFNFEEKLQETTQKTTKEESQSTSVSATIEAEDGKEKSVTIGGTKVVSNGARVTVESETNTSFKDEQETTNKEILRQLDEERRFSSAVNESLISLKSEFEAYKESHKQETSVFSKWVKKQGWQTWVIVLAVFAVGIFAFSRWLDSRKPI